MAERFRKKLAEVRAMQWTGANRSDIEAFAHPRFEEVDPIDRHMLDDPEATASLLTDPHSTWELVFTGDWIIRDTEGRITRCPADEFAETYEVAGG